MNTEEIKRRKVLWSAFSDLWLDNEVQQYTIDHIALKMKQSGYSLAELKHIYQHEVAPAVYRNLLVVTGVWDGFDEDWLFNEINNNLNKPSFWKKFCFYINKSKMFYATKDDWDTLETLFLANTPHD